MTRKVHNHGRKSAYRNDGERQEWRGGLGYIFYNKRFKQLCVLAPALFSIFLSAILEDAFRDMGDGAYIQSRQNADLFTVSHFRAKRKNTNILVRELLFADDDALIAHSAEEIQSVVDAFASASSKFGLKINIKKRSDVPTELYNGNGGGHQCRRNHTKPCERIHISQQYNSKRRSR